MAKKESIISKVVIYIIIIIVLFIVTFPIFWTFTNSIKPANDIYALPPKFIFKATLEHWNRLIIQSSIGPFIQNSLIVASINGLLSVILGSLAAYALLRIKNQKLEQNIAIWAMSNRAVPPIVSIIPIYIITLKLGLYDTRSALIAVYFSFNLPFALWMMLGYLRSVPIELEEAAMIDGCSRLRVIWNIILPLSKPGLIVTLIFCFIFAWNEFLFSFLLTSSDASTIPVATSRFITATGVWWGPLSALAVIQLLPTMIISIIFQGQIVRGLAFGALKE